MFPLQTGGALTFFILAATERTPVQLRQHLQQLFKSLVSIRASRVLHYTRSPSTSAECCDSVLLRSSKTFFFCGLQKLTLFSKDWIFVFGVTSSTLCLVTPTFFFAHWRILEFVSTDNLEWNEQFLWVEHCRKYLGLYRYTTKQQRSSCI